MPRGLTEHSPFTKRRARMDLDKEPNHQDAEVAKGDLGWGALNIERPTSNVQHRTSKEERRRSRKVEAREALFV